MRVTGEERKKSVGGLLKEIITDNFPNLRKRFDYPSY